MKFYRYETHITGGYDSETDTSWSNPPQLWLQEFELFKETPKGYWICHDWNKQEPFKWIPKSSKKRFAYPTRGEALHNFILRTERSIEIMRARISTAEQALKLANEQKLSFS